MRDAFVAEHRPRFSARAMCRCLRIHPSGFYACLKNRPSKRAKEDARQTELIQKAWEESGKVYGYRKLYDDLLNQGETICPNRVARLAKLAGIQAQISYKRRPGSYGGKPSVIVDNTLARQFNVEAADRVWVIDITYIRTLEGFAYLASRSTNHDGVPRFYLTMGMTLAHAETGLPDDLMPLTIANRVSDARAD